MPVPKMVKNGSNSALISRERAACNRRHGHARNPKLSSNLKRRIKTIFSQFRNNHARYHQTPFNTPKGFDENLPKKIPVYVGSPITPFSVGAKATLKPSNPIKKNAEHVIMIFFNKLLVSSSPSSHISKRPTDIVTIKTKTPNIKTQDIVKVFPSQTCHLSTQVSGTQRLILSSIQDQPVRSSLPQSQRFFLNWGAAGF
jgi:hypothetical protein